MEHVVIIAFALAPSCVGAQFHFAVKSFTSECNSIASLLLSGLHFEGRAQVKIA
jgi:hypothetical protein